MNLTYRLERRVVITGLGIVSPAGIGKEEFWASISAGRSCIRHITRFDTSGHKVNIAGEISNFSPAAFLGVELSDQYHRPELYAVCACKLAIEDGRLAVEDLDPERTGIALGTSAGGMESTVGRLLRSELSASGDDCDTAAVSELFSVFPGNLAATVRSFLGLNGTCIGISTGCTAASDAIGYGFEHIRAGLADVMLVGGSEAPIEPVTIQAFDAIGTLSRRNDPLRSSRPFDKDRDGFVIGEGAGILVLEELSHALTRRAHIYAEVAAYQTACDAYHLTSSDPAMIAATHVIQSALDEANLQPEAVDHITAHGSSTQMNDARETAVIKRAFGDYAYKIPISGLKSMIGHTSGAAGAMQAIGASLSLENQYVPPTINYDTASPDCDLDYVPNKGRGANLHVVLQNTYAYAGKNTAILYRRFEGAPYGYRV